MASEITHSSVSTVHWSLDLLMSYLHWFIVYLFIRKEDGVAVGVYTGVSGLTSKANK